MCCFGYSVCPLCFLQKRRDAVGAVCLVHWWPFLALFSVGDDLCYRILMLFVIVHLRVSGNISVLLYQTCSLFHFWSILPRITTARKPTWRSLWFAQMQSTHQAFRFAKVTTAVVIWALTDATFWVPGEKEQRDKSQGHFLLCSLQRRFLFLLSSSGAALLETSRNET